jgi:hypothetical protein
MISKELGDHYLISIFSFGKVDPEPSCLTVEVVKVALTQVRLPSKSGTPPDTTRNFGAVAWSKINSEKPPPTIVTPETFFGISTWTLTLPMEPSAPPRPAIRRIKSTGRS